MGNIYMTGGGSKINSNELSITKDYVLKDRTYVGADTNDEIGIGTMPNLTKNATTQHASDNSTKVILGDNAYLSKNTDNIYRTQIRYMGDDGYLEKGTLIGIEQEKMAAAGGLTADKMIKGQSCLGINGTTGAAYKDNIRLLEIPNNVIYTTRNFSDFIKYDNRTLIFEGPLFPEYEYIILRRQYNGDPAVTLGKINTSVETISRITDSLQMVTYQRNKDGIVKIYAINYNDRSTGITIDIVGHTNINISGFTNW